MVYSFKILLQVSFRHQNLHLHLLQ